MTFTQITDGIEQAYAGLDVARTSALGGLLRIREVKAKSLQRDLEAGKASGDKTLIERSAALVANNDELIASLKRDAMLSSTKVPARKKNAATVHGYVWLEHQGKAEPVAKARVRVFQAVDAELGKKLAEANTNNRGYFKIAVPIRATADKASSRDKAEEKTGNGIVAVLDRSGKEPAGAQRIPLAPNSLSFRELVLTKESPDMRRTAKRKR